MKNIPVKPLIVCFVLIAIVSFVFFIIGFFINLNSTLSDYAWGDVSYHHQVFYNFVNGQPFQTSLYRNVGVGNIDSPYPYAHQFSIHINFTPYLLSFIYKLYQSLNMLYLIVILFNCLGTGYFTWRILKHLSPEDALGKSLLTLCLFATSGALLFIQHKAHFILFSPPFIMAAYYFMLKGKKAAFLLTIILLSLISEDAAIFVITFSIYILIFEPERRVYSLFSAGFAIIYLLLVVLIIQPAARYGMSIESSSHFTEKLSNALRMVFSGDFSSLLLSLLWTGVYCFPLVFAGIIIYFMFEKTTKPQWPKIIGLILIAPLSHWLIAVLSQDFSFQHFAPIISCIFLSLLVLLQSVKYEINRVLPLPRLLWLVIFLVVYLQLGFYLMKDNLMPFTGSVQGAESHQQKTSNKAVIEIIHKLPPDKSVVYWANKNIEAFITNRSNIWRFPYYFDKVDFLVIQKDAKETWFRVNLLPGRNLRECLAEGKFYAIEETAPVSQKVIDKTLDDLVRNQNTHRILMDDRYILVLERINRNELLVPPSTVGFGWIENINK